MRGCGRQWCSSCDEELIHRDNRHHYESASGFGQIVRRDGPDDWTFGDIDGYFRLWMRDRTLLRFLEHKQPRQEFKDQQRRALWDLDAIIEHAITCPDSPIPLHPASGVFLIRGLVQPETSWPKRLELVGPQVVKNRRLPPVTLDGAADVFRWMEADYRSAVAAS